jgi:hypothetical protein
VKRLFQGLSRIRGKRIFHPFGVGFAARLTPWGEATSGAIAFDREAEALVRLSRSFGLPESIPDPCGIALRIPDLHGPGAHQDLLMVTSGAPPGARHALLPSRGFCDLPYSTILPYRLGGETVLLGARALAPRPGPRLADLVELETGGLEFEIRVARPGGDWRPVARLALGPRLPGELTERLGFDPTHTGGGLELVGLLNRLRGPAYRGSQMGRYASYSS